MRYQDFNTRSLLKESDENIEVRLDGQVVPGPYNDIDHARNKASKLVSYQKGKIGEVYVNGKLKMRMQLNQPREYFDEQQLGNNRFSDYDQWRDQVEQVGASVYPQKDRVRLVAQSWDGDVIGEFNLRTNQGWFGPQGVAEGKGDFAQAIENLHGWYEEESSNPNIRVWEFDDREGGYYAQGTVYYDVTTGRVKIKFEDRDGYHGGDVNDTFDSIGDAMNVLKNITVQIRPNTGKARDFDKLGGRTVAGPDDLYKTDRAGRKGTLNKSRMDIMKASSPYRKTGPEGQLPESSVAEGFDELDAYIKSKNAPKPRGGAGVKQGVYGTPERKRGRGRGPIGGSGSATPSNRDFSRPHSIPRATPRGIDDYDANYRRELDETGGLPPNVLDLIKKIAQSTAAPEHKTAMINSLIAKHASDQGPNKHKVKTQEGLMPGEYYTYQVTFDDGSTDTINVRSDEFDFRSHYAKKGKTVTRVVQQGGIQGSGFGGTTNDPYADSRERQDRTSRAMRQYDRKLAEVAQKLRAKYLSK